MRVVNIRRRGVLRTHRPTHPLLIPPHLVHAIVMAAAVTHRHFVELRMKEQRTERTLSTGGRPEDTYTRDVVVGILRCNGLVPQNAIRKACVCEVLEGHIVEGLGAVAGAHAIDMHHDEAQLGERLVRSDSAEGLRHERALRPGVDVLNHRILHLRIKVQWPSDRAPDVGLAIASLRNKDLRETETRR